MVYDSSVKKTYFYLNGTLACELSGSGLEIPDYNRDNRAYLMWDNHHAKTTGSIDEFIMLDYPLSHAEV